jgi:hypothetical protein
VDPVSQVLIERADAFIFFGATGEALEEED